MRRSRSKPFQKRFKSLVLFKHEVTKVPVAKFITVTGELDRIPLFSKKEARARMWTLCQERRIRLADVPTFVMMIIAAELPQTVAVVRPPLKIERAKPGKKGWFEVTLVMADQRAAA